MKNFSALKFILLTYAFSWIMMGVPILNGQSSKDFPAILFYIIGGCGPSLIALIFVFRTFNPEERRVFWGRVVNPCRVKPAWWIISLVVIPMFMFLGAWVNTLLGGTAPQMDYFNLLKTRPAEIPVFLIMMMIGGPLAEELGWRGILLKTFQKKWSVPVSTLVLFLIWWLWHLPLFFLQGTSHFAWGVFTDMFWLFTMNVFLLSILMTIAHNTNQSSVLIVILIHFSYNTTLSLLAPYTTQTFAFITTFLGILVISLLAVRKFSSVKVLSTVKR